MTEPTAEEQTAELQKYWAERLDDFEKVWPVFEARRIGRNTAMMVWMMDDLQDSLILATAARQGKLNG